MWHLSSERERQHVPDYWQILSFSRKRSFPLHRCRKWYSHLVTASIHVIYNDSNNQYFNIVIIGFKLVRSTARLFSKTVAYMRKNLVMDDAITRASLEIREVQMSRIDLYLPQH